MDELLKYLTVSADIPCVNLFTNNWDHAEASSERAEAVTLDTFDAAMDAQMDRLDELLREVPVVREEVHARDE